MAWIQVYKHTNNDRSHYTLLQPLQSSKVACVGSIISPTRDRLPIPVLSFKPGPAIYIAERSQAPSTHRNEAAKFPVGRQSINSFPL